MNSMEPIESILQEILRDYEPNQEWLAKELGVSPSTVSRWVKGHNKPRPVAEGRLREIYSKLRTSPQNTEEPTVRWIPIANEATIRNAVDATLRDLREVLHRRGRLSSRNEALDELCKLLFAHIMSVTEGNDGITRKNVLGDRNKTRGAAQLLKEYTRNVVSSHLPSSLAHEMALSDFELRIKSQEDLLALEIIDCFAPFTAINAHIIGNVRTDILNDVFGKFLSDSFIDEKQLGQYLTPAEVIRFMVRLAILDLSDTDFDVLCDPNRCPEFGLIMDPSCGVGSFLTEIYRTLQDQVMSKHGVHSARKWAENLVTNVLVGIDKSERMLRLALTNIAMFGLPAARLHLANSLSRFGSDSELTESLLGKVRMILTNPPFGAEFDGADLAEYKIATTWTLRPPKKINSELLFMERYLDWLAPGGQLLAIVPDSILTNKGIYENLRRNIADKVEIRSVTSLPPVTFGVAGTSTKTSILHLRKRQPRDPLRSTFFAVCQDIGYSVATKESHRTKITNGESDLPRILNEFSAPDSNLTLGCRAIDVEKSSRWDANFHASLSPQLKERIDNPFISDVFVSDVAELSTDKTDPRRWGTGTFQYIEISDVDLQTCMVHTKTLPCSEAPSRARKLVRAGDILFSTVRPENQTVGVVGEHQDGSVCTTGFAVLRPKTIDSLTLAYLLKTDFVRIQVLRNNVGIAYPAIDESCLLGVLLPINRSNIESLGTYAQHIMSLEQKVIEARIALNEALKHTTTAWTELGPNPNPRLHQCNQTRSRYQSHKADSDSRGQVALELGEGHKA